jgi:ribosomal protein S18 acetylase RimI-like enzyme
MRPERADDDAFLFALFRSHTERPLRRTGLADAAIETLVGFQYRSQTANNRALFPEAVFSIIEMDGVPIGRLVEHDEGATVYFVDFAWLPEHQAKGLGTAYIEMVADEWAAKGRAARVEVRYDNAHSLKLCRNCGFVRQEDKGMGFINLIRPIDPAKRATP